MGKGIGQEGNAQERVKGTGGNATGTRVRDKRYKAWEKLQGIEGKGGQKDRGKVGR